MEITYIKLKRIRNHQKLVAIADVTIDGAIAIHGIKILMNNNDELFIDMPSKKNTDGTYSDIVHPISISARSIFEKLLFAATEKLIKENHNYLKCKITHKGQEEAIEQSLKDFTIEGDNVMRFVDKSVKEEILSWLYE